VLAVRGDVLTEIQTVSTLPPGTEVSNKTAEIIIDHGAHAAQHPTQSHRQDCEGEVHR
jgi:hypothetical protein